MCVEVVIVNDTEQTMDDARKVQKGPRVLTSQPSSHFISWSRSVALAPVHQIAPHAIGPRLFLSELVVTQSSNM